MAGEWLKFESNLPDKPETLAITVAMGWDDPDLTVGKLMRLFRWFDQHTVDGNARGVTPALLDRLIGVTGFIKAVSDVGWLIVTDTGLALHNFDYHNGKTAKDRALTAKRVAKHKAVSEEKTGSNAKSNGQSVSAPLPREEKRREEKTIKPKPLRDATAFARFWSAYPKKVGKIKTEKAFAKVDVGLLDAILKAIALQSRSEQWQKEKGQFIPNPATWLNEGRWTDEPHVLVVASSIVKPVDEQVPSLAVLPRKTAAGEEAAKQAREALKTGRAA